MLSRYFSLFLGGITYILDRCQCISWSNRDAKAKPLACHLVGYKIRALDMLSQKSILLGTSVRDSLWKTWDSSGQGQGAEGVISQETLCR